MSQLDLDAAADPVRRQRMLRPGASHSVQEMAARSALTPCAMPEDVWSLNPYIGCSHACSYCYVPSVAHLERDRWGTYVVAKANLPRLLEAELRRKPRKPVFLSSATDPYQPAEGVHRVTRRCLEVLVRRQWPLKVLTRSPLVRRDIPLLSSFAELEVGLSIPTLDDDARRLLEPGAPSIESRLATVRDLADAGLRPFVNVAPAYPFGPETPDQWAAVLKEAGAARVHVWPWRYLEGVLPVVGPRVTGTPYAGLPLAVANPRYGQHQARALRGAFRRAGLGSPAHTPGS